MKVELPDFVMQAVELTEVEAPFGEFGESPPGVDIVWAEDTGVAPPPARPPARRAKRSEGPATTSAGHATLIHRAVQLLPGPSWLGVRLRYGGPEPTPISADYAAGDDQLRAFILNETQFRWTLVALSIAFPDDVGKPLTKARVKVRLSDEGDPPSTIAFSLAPIRLGTPEDGTVGFSIEPKAFGISLIRIDKAPGKGTQSFLLAGEEKSNEAMWTFKATKGQPLEGSWPLAMTVRSPVGKTGKISVRFEAETTKRKGWRMRKQRIPLEPGDPDAVHVIKDF
jgi:hypothetical protein